MSAFEDNLREEFRKLERKYADLKETNDRLVSMRCSNPCNKGDLKRSKALLLLSMELLEASVPKANCDSSEWLSRRCAIRSEIEKLRYD